MIIEQHYDDEVLIGMLEEAEASDPHLPACESCAGSLESYRGLTSALGDTSVWDERELSEDPVPRTSSMLRSMAATTKAEDAAAGPIVAKLCEAGTLQRRELIDAHPQWRTAGTVRKLLEAVDKSNFVEPKLAAEWAELAVDVAQSLESGRYPFETVMILRGKAHRAYAHMLYYTGSYAESVEALDRTDALLRECVVSEYDSARARLVRAQVYNEIERLDEAVSLADSARETFRAFGDVRREAVAEATKAASFMYARRFAEALRIFERLAADSRIDDAGRAFYVHNAAICQRELSRFEESKVLFARSIAEFERLGMATARARARWHLGQLLLAERRCGEARSLLIELRQEFEELGMPQDVALISIDAAEALLMLDRPAEVAHLCHAAMAYFTKAGLAYTQGALTALAYLKEAAEARTLTPKALGDVRAYFELLPKQPDLLFAYPA